MSIRLHTVYVVLVQHDIAPYEEAALEFQTGGMNIKSRKLIVGGT